MDWWLLFLPPNLIWLLWDFVWIKCIQNNNPQVIWKFSLHKKTHIMTVTVKFTQLCPTICDPMDRSLPAKLLYPRDYLNKNTGVGSHSLLQGLNPCLLIAGRFFMDNIYLKWRIQMKSISDLENILWIRQKTHHPENVGFALHHPKVKGKRESTNINRSSCAQYTVRSNKLKVRVWSKEIFIAGPCKETGWFVP